MEVMWAGSRKSTNLRTPPPTNPGVSWQAHASTHSKNSAQERQRTIAGVAYWFPHQGNVSTALLFDYDNATFTGFTPSLPTRRLYAVHALLNF